MGATSLLLVSVGHLHLKTVHKYDVDCELIYFIINIKVIGHRYVS